MDRLTELPSRSLELRLVMGLVYEPEVQQACIEQVEVVDAHDRVRGDADLASADRNLGRRLALERALIEPALAHHHGARGPQAALESQRSGC